MIHTEPSLMRNEDAVQTSRQTILLVDDDDGVSSLVADILEAEGYGVETVSTGAEAEAIIDRLKPDLVILDIMLPDADGLMLCSRLLQQWPAPIIMLSGSRRESDRILSLRLGADDFIAKPFDTFELVARVQAVLRRAPREVGIRRHRRWRRPRPGPFGLRRCSRMAGAPGSNRILRLRSAP